MKTGRKAGHFVLKVFWFYLLYFVLWCCTLVVDYLLNHLVLLLILLDLVVQFGMVKGQANI